MRNFNSIINSIFLSFILSMCCIYSNQEIAGSYRNLIIINGQKVENISKNQGNASTNKLIYALEQRVAPVLVSVNIWRNFVERKQEFAMRASLENTREHKLLTFHNNILKKLNIWTVFFKKNIQNFAEIKQLITQLCIDEFQKELESLKKDNLVQNIPEEELFFNFLIYLLEVNPKEWDFYRVSDHYCLLIPHDYKEKLAAIPNLQSWNGYTQTELILGLKVDHLERIENPLDASLFCFEPLLRKENELITGLHNLFITRNDTITDELHHHWNIFLTGHGAIYLSLYSSQRSEDDINSDDMIAEFSVDEFKNILLFLNDNIKTSLLIYSTCFGAGKHLKKPYLHEGKPLILNYSIVINNVTDVLSYGYGKVAIPPLLHKEKFILDYYDFDTEKEVWNLEIGTNILNWKKLFKIIDRFNKKNDYELLLTNQFLSCLGRNSVYLENIPNVRFAGSEDFVIYPSSTSVKINALMVALKKLSNNPIVVNGQTNILVETEKIDVSLQLQTKDPLVRIISVIPGKASHYIEFFEAKNYLFLDILKAFWPLKSSAFNKTFYIKKLQCSCNPKSQEAKMIDQDTEEVIFNNVMIDVEEDYLVRIFFQNQKGKAFSCYGRCMHNEKEPTFGGFVALDEKTASTYLNHFENAKNKIIEFYQKNENNLFFEKELKQILALNEKNEITV